MGGSARSLDDGVRNGSRTRRARAGVAAVLSAGILAGGCARRELPALHMAARRGDVATIRSLLRNGADIDAPAGVNDWTPLEHAIHKRRAASAKALLAAGADPNGRRLRPGASPGVTPLMMAAGYGQLEIVQALLAAGADPRASRGNVNALWAAAGFGAIADLTDGPPLGSCFPEVADALLKAAPDLKLEWKGFEARLTYWVARKPCKGLIDRLRDPKPAAARRGGAKRDSRGTLPGSAQEM